MNSFTQKILIGLLFALLISCTGSFLFIWMLMPKEEVSYAKLYEMDLLTKVIALGTLPNVLLFHWFLRKNQIYKARGVLLAVLLVALTFAYLKFL